MDANGTPVPGSGRRRNHALWLGPLIAFAGTVSYFSFFARWPALRDVPWLNLPVVLGGVALSLAGARRAFRGSATYRGKMFGAFSVLFAGGFAALFVFYVFVLSYMLPAPSASPLALVEAPDFALQDQRGQTVRLAELRGRKVVVTFYRGHW